MEKTNRGGSRWRHHKQLDRFYTYTANGIAAVAKEWLQSGMDESPEEIASFIQKATNFGLSSFVNEIQ